MAKVCLDAGHGGSDSGAASLGRKEKDDALRMTLRVGQILTANGIEVFYNRTTDVFENVNTKARKANNAGVDFFASFHRNAASGSAKGSETLVYSNSGKAKICADRANQRMQECGFVQRGTKIRTDLAVLNSTNMEAVLFEMGFIDNADDNALFDSAFEKIAQACAEAIVLAVGKNVGNTPAAPTPAPAPVPQPPAPHDAPDVKYQVYSGKWYPDVINTQDYAGVTGKSISGIYANTVGAQSVAGNLRIRVHTVGGGWLPWVTDRQDFAGVLGKAIAAVQMELINCPGHKVQYRVSPLNGEYYPWVTNTEDQGGCAGVFGKAIDRLQIRIV